MFRFLCIAFLTASVFSLFAPAQAYPSAAYQVAATAKAIQYFAIEEAAQRHCPSDVVVWLNTNSGIWHEKGMRWYGRTKHGAYVCRKEAAAAGFRDTRNGQ